MNGPITSLRSDDSTPEFLTLYLGLLGQSEAEPIGGIGRVEYRAASCKGCRDVDRGETYSKSLALWKGMKLEGNWEAKDSFASAYSVGVPKRRRAPREKPKRSENEHSE